MPVFTTGDIASHKSSEFHKVLSRRGFAEGGSHPLLIPAGS